uniref:Phosphatidylethanolamine-binding protein n=1 Tax=Oryza brachyantha TaxID=4533 RepID=J3M811_ORYBR
MAQESLRLGAKKDISPPLEWYRVPDGARSLALVVQDIDAPDPEGPIVPWTHWVVANIPPSVKGLPEGFSGKEGASGREFGGIQEGVNDWKQPGWRGPIPPSRGHRIQFKLYALDDEVTKDKLMDAIQGHVLGEAELTAVF